ncbi:MAG: GNAT family N-acetyltransferase [Actinomycetota bacterium]|nr:GNAT family N-acetyltransferase [Actinomycetota bacterium]
MHGAPVMDRAAWDDVMARTQPFPMYFTSWFTDFACDVSGGARIERSVAEGGDLMATMVMASRDDDQVGRVLNSLPWFGSYGGVALAPGAPGQARTEVLDGVRPLIDDPSVGFAAINLVPSEMAHISEYASVLSPRKVVPRRTQVTALPPGPAGLEESLMDRFHPKARNAIRKGLGQGFRVDVQDTDEAWATLTALHAASMARVGGRAKSAETLRRLREHVPPGNRRLALAHSQRGPVAALLTTRVGRTVEYLVPAVDEEFRATQALSALIWHEMLEASATGARWWNWGGTGWRQESLLSFKARLGGTVVDYATLVWCTDHALRILRDLGGTLPIGLLDYYLYPFSELHEEVPA